MSIINILLVAIAAYAFETVVAFILFVIFRKRIMSRLAYIVSLDVNDDAQCECGSKNDCGCMPR